MPSKPSSKKAETQSTQSAELTTGIPADWQWFLQALDQKLDDVRRQTAEMLERLHVNELKQQQSEQGLRQDLHSYQISLKELDQSLQYLSHKTQLQLKDTEQTAERFRYETEHKVSEIHFATREELSGLTRRIQNIEKLLL